MQIGQAMESIFFLTVSLSMRHDFVVMEDMTHCNILLWCKLNLSFSSTHLPLTTLVEQSFLPFKLGPKGHLHVHDSPHFPYCFLALEEGWNTVRMINRFIHSTIIHIDFFYWKQNHSLIKILIHLLNNFIISPFHELHPTNQTKLWLGLMESCLFQFAEAATHPPSSPERWTPPFRGKGNVKTAIFFMVMKRWLRSPTYKMFQILSLSLGRK